MNCESNASLDGGSPSFRRSLFELYQTLQSYVGWSELDARRLAAARPLLAPHFAVIIDDFYTAIDRHAATRRVLTGGAPQRQRLKQTLLGWLNDLLGGCYDADYVEKRWRIGRRHLELGLEQVYTNAALSRLRQRFQDAVDECTFADESAARELRRSLDRIIDLDLVIIQEAYRTENVRQEQRLEREQGNVKTQRVQDALRAMLLAAPCMIVILNREGLVRYFSPFAERLTGYSADEILGTDYLERFIPSPETAAAIRADIARTLKGTPTTGFVNAISHRDGAQSWMVWNTQPIDDYQGEPVVLAVGLDVTAQRKAQEKLVHSERLAAIGEMMTGLAHESRNALQRSQACLEMLAMEVQDRPQAIQLVVRVQQAQDDLHQLFEEVRDYAAPIRLQLEHHNLRRLVEDTWDHLEVERRARVADLEFESSQGIPRARVDRLQIEQVFRNILENALSACRDPVEISVRIEPARIGAHAAVAVTLRDNGPGLTAESRTRIFEPFFTTKTKGTGLGMAICKRIVDAHGGAISLGPPGARGAEIIVTLPVDGPCEET